MVKTEKIRGLIAERGTTQEVVADEMGINRSTFYRKMKNHGDFTLAEAKMLKVILRMNKEEAIDIFFN